MYESDVCVLIRLERESVCVGATYVGSLRYISFQRWD